MFFGLLVAAVAMLSGPPGPIRSLFVGAGVGICTAAMLYGAGRVLREMRDRG